MKRDALADRAEAAEVRLPTKDGHTIVVTAAELWASRREGRELYERAQFWAAGWRRAAYDFRDRGDVALDALVRLERAQAQVCARLDRYAAVVAAARAAEPHVVWREAREALRDALGALDDATQQG